VNTQRLLRTGAGLGGVFIASALAGRGEPNDKPLALLVGGAGAACMASAIFLKDAKLAGKVKDALDAVLMHWTKNDPFTLRDLLAGGVAIFGRTGSGKTSSSGKALANAIVRHPGSGGLILAAKPEDRQMWEGIFAAAGRSEDLLVFSPESDLRFNFVDYEMQAGGGHTRNITDCLMVIGETLHAEEKAGGEDAQFWKSANRRVLNNAVEILKLATGKVGAPELHEFIGTAAETPEQITSEEWRASSFHNQVFRAAYAKSKTERTQPRDYKKAEKFWLREYPRLNERTRSSIMAGVNNILDTFNTGVVCELVSTTTNVTPEDMFRGRWVFVDMAPSEWGVIGSFVAGGWKYLTERAILRRAAQNDSNFVTIWADEAQLFVNTYDADFISRCRSHRGCLVYLTQSIHSYFSAMHGERGKHQAKSLLTNFQTKVFHALGDAETAEWAGSHMGRSKQTFIGGSMSPQESMLDELMGKSKYTGSFNQQYEKVLQDNVFMNDLRTGGHANGLLCDCIVYCGGNLFANGQSWARVTFSQE
jgi:hypothetical protein